MIVRALDKVGKRSRNDSQAVRGEKAPVEVEKWVEGCLRAEMPTGLEVSHIDIEMSRVGLHELLTVKSIGAEVVKEAYGWMYLSICRSESADDKLSEFRFDVGQFHGRRSESPNDPELSDCGGRRAGCGKATGAGWAKAAGWSVAASVTPGPVRCSAWLGVSGFINVAGFEQRLDGGILYVVGRCPPRFVCDGRVGSGCD